MKKIDYITWTKGLINNIGVQAGDRLYDRQFEVKNNAERKGYLVELFVQYVLRKHEDIKNIEAEVLKKDLTTKELEGYKPKIIQVTVKSSCFYVQYYVKDEAKKITNTKNKKRPQVKLSGENGNAYNILGLVIKELQKNGYTQEEIDEYQKEAKSGDYDNLLQVTGKWVDIY